MSRNRLHRCRKSEPASGRGLRHCADQRRNIVARELLNTLYVTTQGAYVHADHETLRVEAGDETILPGAGAPSGICGLFRPGQCIPRSHGQVRRRPAGSGVPESRRTIQSQSDRSHLRKRTAAPGSAPGSPGHGLGRRHCSQYRGSQNPECPTPADEGSSPNRRRRVGNGIERRRQRNGQRHTIPSQVRQHG